MQTLLRIRTSMSKKRRTEGGQQPAPGLGPVRTVEKTAASAKKRAGKAPKRKALSKS
jgi:hypothetical protein